jgi:phenylacetate-CoA ligase
MDSLTVAVETRSGLGIDTAEASLASTALQNDVKSFVGTSVSIELRVEGGVERSVGKAKRVLDLRRNSG